MKKRNKICLYVFLVCAFIALGILGYFVISPQTDNVRAHSRKFVTFNSVSNASSYMVTAQDSSGNVGADSLYYNVIKVESQEADETYFTIQVSSDVGPLATERYTQTVLSSNKDSDKIDCMISSYTISFFSGEDTLYFDDQLLKDVDKDIFCSIVSECLPTLFTFDGTYTIYLTALDEMGQPIEQNTEYSFSYSADSEEEFLRRGEYYYDGEWLDYVIESEEELEKLVWWAILYREAQNDLSFYIKTDDIDKWNVNNLVINAINNYPEYDALEDNSVFALADDNVGRLINFDYYLDENFTLCYKDLEDMDTSSGKDYYNLALTQLHKIDESYMQDYYSHESSGERTFAIDSIENEVVVYNTEQLFMVARSGAKPVFVSGKSDVAQEVYNNARDVLKTINNSDELSSYEKIVNIYRYICGQVVYDYVTYSYMQLKNDYSIKHFGGFSCFYLEGVFYDFGMQTHYAVCDGLSKAFCLLCNIEGIDCIKINGSVGDGNHAWNRVFINDVERGLDGYYYVDTTWGEGVYTMREENYQVLTHTYFLYDYAKTEREIFYPENLERVSPSSVYDYYKNTFYLDLNGESQTLYVDSDDSLRNILLSHDAKVSDENTNVVCEFEISTEYLKDSSGLYYEIRSISREVQRLSNNIEYLENRIADLEEKILKLKLYGGWSFALNNYESDLRQSRVQLASYEEEYNEMRQREDAWFENLTIQNKCEWIDLADVAIFKFYK